MSGHVCLVFLGSFFPDLINFFERKLELPNVEWPANLSEKLGFEVLALFDLYLALCRGTLSLRRYTPHLPTMKVVTFLFLLTHEKYTVRPRLSEQLGTH